MAQACVPVIAGGCGLAQHFVEGTRQVLRLLLLAPFSANAIRTGNAAPHPSCRSADPAGGLGVLQSSRRLGALGPGDLNTTYLSWLNDPSERYLETRFLPQSNEALKPIGRPP